MDAGGKLRLWSIDHFFIFIIVSIVCGYFWLWCFRYAVCLNCSFNIVVYACGSQTLHIPGWTKEERNPLNSLILIFLHCLFSAVLFYLYLCLTVDTLYHISSIIFDSVLGCKYLFLFASSNHNYCILFWYIKPCSLAGTNYHCF